MLRDIHAFFGEYQLELNENFSIKPSVRVEFIDKNIEFIKKESNITDGSSVYGQLLLQTEDTLINVKETNYFTRSQPDDVFKEIALLNMVFEDSNIQGGQLSDLIELKEDKAVVFELVNFQDQKTEGYETVREKVKIELKNRLLEEKMIFLQSKIFEALNSGESLDTISANEGIKVASYKGIKRDSSLFPKATLSEIFSLPMSSQSTTFSSAPLPGGDRLIFSLNAINEIDQTISDEEITSLKQYFSKERSESEMVDLQINMQNSAAITLKNSSN